MNYFNNVVKKVEELVDEVKVLSWRWFLYRLKVSICFDYQWCWIPKDCILRWVFLESSGGSSISYRYYRWLLVFITSVSFLHGVFFSLLAGCWSTTFIGCFFLFVCPNMHVFGVCIIDFGFVSLLPSSTSCKGGMINKCVI